MKFLVALMLVALTLRADDFISEFEYGQMLYQNPRGASCAPCHGVYGEGALIAKYKDHGVEKELRGPSLHHSDLATFRRMLLQGSGVMPRYFLTDKEIHALYLYVKKAKELEKDRKLAALQEEKETAEDGGIDSNVSNESNESNESNADALDDLDVEGNVSEQEDQDYEGDESASSKVQ